MFAANLKELRKKNGLTQKQVAEMLNIDRSTYTYYELGKTSPNPTQLVVLAKMFNASIDSMLDYQPQKIMFNDRKSVFTPAEPFPILHKVERELLIAFRLLNKEQRDEYLKQIKQVAQITRK